MRTGSSICLALALSLSLSLSTSATRAQAPPEDPPKPAPPPPPPDAEPPPPAAPTPTRKPAPPLGASVKLEPASVAPAPEPDGERKQQRGRQRHGGRPAWGGLGYASIGYMMGSLSALEGTLAKADVLGTGYGPPSAGIVLGGGGGALLGGRLWLGGKGFGLGVATPVGKGGEAELGGGGGGFELGYAAHSRDEWLVIPYIGAGGFGYGLTVRNFTSAAYPVFEGEDVPAESSRDFQAGFLTAEIGVRAFRLLFWGDDDGKGRGGFAIGAELGYTAALGRGHWQGATERNVGQETADLSAAYVRITLGGGGFWYLR